jgi:hypothetical protein
MQVTLLLLLLVVVFAIAVGKLAQAKPPGNA